MTRRTPTLLSLAALARAIDAPYARASELLREDILRPDFIGPNNTALFRPARLEKLRATLLIAAQSPQHSLIPS